MSYYNDIAQGYEELHKVEQLKKVNLIKEKIALKENDKLLDVGCGTGITTKFWNCKKYGADPAIKLLQRADGGTYTLAEAEHLPFKDNSFDVVLSITALQNFHNIKLGLEEIKRVGKDKFVLTFLKKSTKNKEIDRDIRSLFKVKEVIEEDKDMIYLVGF